jgi:aryl-alcohol dehydrogenase-like predicted oxidoreductase
VFLCHEANIEDPSVYLEAFEVLKEQGRLRAYGISTNSLDVLKRFNVNGTCQVVEVNYSLCNRAPEAEFFPYCQEHGIAVLIRGPLRRGVLSGNYDLNTVFTDSVRSRWNAGESARQEFERDIALVEKLKQQFAPGRDMVTAALRFAISHPVAPVAIPGAKSPQQAAANAETGAQTLSADEVEALIALIEK